MESAAIALLEAQKEGARRPMNLVRLAQQYGRTPGGIEMVLRWAQRAKFPARADNRIKRQVEAARKKLGLEK